MNDLFDHFEGLCKEQDTFGFDLNAGESWVYPTNYPIRDYQFNITQKALHQNTMVCLPTGLGKTFIAAVVMYNFYRWYPLGKIIFMAPTKPLVTQQMDACYNIMAIPENVTAEITGTKSIASRTNIWNDKRVFFITPQILQNDIDTVLDLAPQIRCIVVDEAHKALGKHANCEAIKKIYNINKNFRVLALSATPGSNFNSVRDVIQNLLISHIEVRTNESIDVAPYVFQRKLDTIVIPTTGKLLEVKNEFIKILDTYTRPLIQNNIFSGNCANITKGRIVLIMKDFKEKGRHHSSYSFILRNLNICVTLYHGYELLIRHGLRGFLTFFEDNISKPLLNSMQELHNVLENVRNYLGPTPDINMLPDGTIPEITDNVVFSHPKFNKLTEVLLEHFAQVQDADTRIMVFCEYRESVMETYTILLRYRPTIKPRIFLGQGAISQAQQIQTVRMFKSGACNTLVSTCIGEEGLDVGEVDLIVCFDISSKSPIRMVQRMGRTGRKRDGRVVVLVTEGKEQQLLQECMAQKTTMISLLESPAIKSFLYKQNPRMIPATCKPECHKMFITVRQKEPSTKKPKQTKKTEKKNTVKSMFANITSSQTSSTSASTTMSTNSEPSEDPKDMSAVSSTKWIKSPVKGKTTSPVKKGSSVRKTMKKMDLSKQHDLRSMFTKLSNTQSTVTSTTTTNTDSSTEVLSQTSYEIETEPANPKLTTLLENIQSYLALDINNNVCALCENLFHCKKHTSASPINGEWTNPDESISNRVTFDSIKQYIKSLHTSSVQPKNSINNSAIEDNLETSLDYFNLDSITDIFSDDSMENVQTVVQNPIIFTQSFGEFKSPQKSAIHEEDDVVVISDTEQSPTLHSYDRVLGFKTKVQKKLFTQASSTPNTNIISDNKHLNWKINNVTPKNTSIIALKQREVSSNLKICDKLNNKSKETANKNINNVSNCKDMNNSLQDVQITHKTNTKQINSSSSKTNKQEGVNLVKQQINCSSTVLDVSKSSTSPKNTSNSSMTSMLNVSNDENFQIWDESIFETSDVEDTNFVLRITPKKLGNSNEIKTKNQSYDSNEMVMLSFDENDFEPAPNTSRTVEIMHPAVKTNISNNRASLLNKTDNSLLSVTQMIDCLNDSKNNSKSFDNCSKNTKLLEENAEKADEVISFFEKKLNLSSYMPNENTENKDTLLSPLIVNKISKFKNNVQNSPTNTMKDILLSPNRTPASTQNRTQRLHSTPRTTINNPNNSPILSNNKQNIQIKPNTSQSPMTNNKGISNKLRQNLKTNEKSDQWNKTVASDKPTISINFKTTNENSPNNSQKINSQTSTKENKVISQQSTMVDDFDIQEILKDVKFSESSDEEQSLLSFSQNSKNNRRKKFKLQLTQNTAVKDTNITSSQDSPVKQPKKKVLNMKQVIEISDSDDDFQIKPTWTKPTPLKQRTQSVTSSRMRSKQTTVKSRSQSESRSTVRNVKKRKHPVCEFIDYEAQIEDDEHFVPDSQHSQEDSEDLLDSSFINDTQSICDQSDMQAKYLQSVRSPKLYLPSKPKVYLDVFSQEVDDQNDTYMNDSFCVGNDVTLSQRHQMSYLEMAEAELERNRKSKKRKRIVQHSDSD